MFDPVIHLAVVVSPGLLLLLSVALAVLLMAMLFGLIEANVILRSAAWVTITFVVCGLVTALVGLLLFGFLYAFGKEAVLLQLCIVLTSVGVLAIAIPFLPEAWLVGEAAAEPRSRMAFRFLLGFALVGFLVGLPVAIAPPITFQSIRAALFWICPGAIPGTMFGGGSFAAVVLTGLFNGIFFGAFGSIIGIVASLLRVPKKPTAVAIAAALVLSIPGRAFFSGSLGAR